MKWTPRRVGVWFLPLLMLGCGLRDRRPSEPSYLPDPAAARRAVEAALEAWRNADPSAPTPDPPGVKFVDQHRKPGRRLLQFQVLGEVAVENARQFTARLELDGEPEPVLVRYIVFGIRPTWVFRLEDYELISHWEHKMDEPEAAPR